MSSLILPRRFTQQPQYPVELNEEWASKGTAYFAVGNDIARVADGTVVTPEGIAGKFTANVARETYIPYLDGEGSIWIDFTPRTGTGSYGYMGGLQTAANYFALAYNHSGAGNIPIVYDGAARTLNQSYIAPDQRTTLMVQRDSGGSSQYLRSSVNGAPIVQGAAVLARTGTFKLFDASDLGADFDVRVYLGYTNYKFTDEDVRRLHENPWQIFKRQPQRLYFDVAAGGIASLIIPRRFTEQPQGAVEVDRSNQLGSTITHCIPLNGINREIITGSQLTLGSGGSEIVDIRGRSLKGSGTAACASLPLNLSAYKYLSISFWLYWDAYATDDDLALEYGSNYNTNSGFIVDPNDPTSTFAVFAGNTTANNGGRFARPSAAAWHHYSISIDRGVGAGVQGVTVYVDGVLQTFTTSITNSLSSSFFGNNSLYLFSRNNSALFGAGRLQNIVVRGGYLISAAEALAEYLDPWQIFKAPSRRLYFAVGGASPTGTIALTLESFITAFTGTTTVLGSMANTLAAATSAFTGTTTVKGTIANTLGTSVADFQGEVGQTGPEGTIALNLENSPASLAGTTAVVGSIGNTLEDHSTSMSGTTTILGTIANSLDNVLTAFSGYPGTEAIIAKLRTMIGTGK